MKLPYWIISATGQGGALYNSDERLNNPFEYTTRLYGL